LNQLVKLKIPHFSLSRRTSVTCIVAAVAVVGLGVYWMRRHASAAEPAPAEAADPPTVGVAQVIRQDLYQLYEMTAEFRPYVQVELHAKVSGYVKDMYVDFGDRVTNGELMATLEVPELHDELTNAIAAEDKAETDYTNANLIYTRLLGVNREHPNLVAQQDIDTAQANDLAAAAAIAEAKAEVGKYETLVGYTQIIAPFDGVITRRSADPGALIEAGTSTDTTMPLVRVSDNYLLRLDFPVDLEYVQDVHLGDPVQVRVESLGNKTFTGTIKRFTYDVNDQTRKMITEIEVANPDLEIKPGMYAYVDLQVEKRPQALAVPTQAVIAGNPPTVYVVNANNQIEERPVKLGLETADRYEVLSGLREGELVVIGNPSAYEAGEKVQPKMVQLSLNSAP
jgi:RND family efflux transporter MFP subunit